VVISYNGDSSKSRAQGYSHYSSDYSVCNWTLRVLDDIGGEKGMSMSRKVPFTFLTIAGAVFVLLGALELITGVIILGNVAPLGLFLMLAGISGMRGRW
jgi:hypothetical protein